MKKQLLGALISKYQEFSKDFQMVQVNISNAINERSVRQALIYDKNLSEEELNQIRENPEVFFFFFFHGSFKFGKRNYMKFL